MKIQKMCSKSSSYTLLFLGISILALLPRPTFSQHSDVDAAEQLDKLLPQLMLENNIPGLAIALIGKSEEKIVRTYGVTNSESGNPVTSATIFEAASTAKPMFAWLVMSLVEQDLIALDQPLSDIEEFESIAEDERSKLITTRMILSHSSGLPNALPRGELPTIMFTPGTQYQYSGWGFRYLQRVVENLTQRSLSEVMSAQVFVPLNMTESSYLWQEKFETIAADGHSADGSFSREIVKLDSAYAEGGVVTNIIELVQFLEFTLAAYRSGNSTLNLMLFPTVQVENYGNRGSIWRGLGWALERTPQGMSIWHGGSNGAFKAFLFLDLEQESGFAMLANSANGLELVPEIVETFFGEHHLFREYFNSP